MKFFFANLQSIHDVLVHFPYTMSIIIKQTGPVLMPFLVYYRCWPLVTF